MTAPEATLDHLSQQMRDAHAKVWDRYGRRLPDSTDADHQEWVAACERWQKAHDRKWGRGPEA